MKWQQGVSAVSVSCQSEIAASDLEGDSFQLYLFRINISVDKVT